MDVAKIRERIEARLEAASADLEQRPAIDPVVPGLVTEIRELIEALQRLDALGAEPPPAQPPALNVPQLHADVWNGVCEQGGTTATADQVVSTVDAALRAQGVTP